MIKIRKPRKRISLLECSFNLPSFTGESSSRAAQRAGPQNLAEEDHPKRFRGGWPTGGRCLENLQSAPHLLSTASLSFENQDLSFSIQHANCVQTIHNEIYDDFRSQRVPAIHVVSPQAVCPPVATSIVTSGATGVGNTFAPFRFAALRSSLEQSYSRYPYHISFMEPAPTTRKNGWTHMEGTVDREFVDHGCPFSNGFNLLFLRLVEANVRFRFELRVDGGLDIRRRLRGVLDVSHHPHGLRHPRL